MYGDVESFRNYHTARGRTIPTTWSDDNITSILLLSTEWIDNTYEDSFIGYKTGGYEQVMSWPRTSAQIQKYPYHVFSDTEIPDKVINATYEVAYRELTTPGTLDKDFSPEKYDSVSVSGAVSVSYNKNLSQTSDVQTRFAIVEKILSDLFDKYKDDSFSSFSGSVSRV